MYGLSWISQWKLPEEDHSQWFCPSQVPQMWLVCKAVTAAKRCLKEQPPPVPRATVQLILSEGPAQGRHGNKSDRGGR
jgi:hypothetical protein